MAGNDRQIVGKRRGGNQLVQSVLRLPDGTLPCVSSIFKKPVNPLS